MKANAELHLFSSLVWIDSGVLVSQHSFESCFHEIKCNGMTSFMEFMISKKPNCKIGNMMTVTVMTPLLWTIFKFNIEMTKNKNCTENPDYLRCLLICKHHLRKKKRAVCVTACTIFLFFIIGSQTVLFKKVWCDRCPSHF